MENGDNRPVLLISFFFFLLTYCNLSLLIFPLSPCSPKEQIGLVCLGSGSMQVPGLCRAEVMVEIGGENSYWQHLGSRNERGRPVKAAARS